MRSEIHLSENIIRLRHEKRLTQEALADFMGVTKASVSKWENAQSMPDILLLPQLAAFFGVTIDELMGYEACLTGQQIQRCYKDLSEAFAGRPFQEALGQVRTLARRYYSCYPLLLQLCILYWNHYMLAESEDEGRQLLQEAVSWCDRILENCSDAGVCSDALVLKAGLLLHLGRAAEAADMLEPISDPGRMAGQSESLLIQAYRAAGKVEKARSSAQIKQYLELINLVGDGAQLLALYAGDLERCRETVRRIRGIMELYQMDELHPNLTSQFHYQTALIYGENGKKKETLEALELFEKSIHSLLKEEEIVLHGDAYFDMLDTWIEKLPLGRMAPRDRGFVRDSLRSALSHPALACVRESGEYQKLEKRICGR